jgi:hypothetical protein
MGRHITCLASLPVSHDAGVIALVGEEGHRNALEAIQRFHVLEKETVRFQSLMALLGTGDPTLQLTCML